MYDYSDLSDRELSEELIDTEKDIKYWQDCVVKMRKAKNVAMESREDIIQEMKKRGMEHGR